MLKKGQAIIEVLVGFGIAVIGMMAVLQLTNKSISNSGFAERQALATRYAQEGLDWVKGEVYTQGWQAIYDAHVGGTFCINDLVWTATGGCGGGVISGTEYSRTLELTSVVVGGKTIMNGKVTTTYAEGSRDASTTREYEFIKY